MNIKHNIYKNSGIPRILILLLLTLIMTNCKGQSQTSSTPYSVMLNTLLQHSVDEVEVESILTAKSLDTYVLLDAREEKEYAVSHLKNAIYVGYDDFDMERVANLDHSDTILVYCSVGYRSEKIAEKLYAEGFESVYNLYGGLFEWVNQGGTVVDKNEIETKDIHGYDPTWSIWLKEGNIILDK